MDVTKMIQDEILSVVIDKIIELNKEVTLIVTETKEQIKGKLIKYENHFGISSHSQLEFETKHIINIDCDKLIITLKFKRD